VELETITLVSSSSFNN